MRWKIHDKKKKKDINDEIILSSDYRQKRNLNDADAEVN